MVALHAAVAQIRRDVQGLCCPKMGLTIIDERWTRVENAATQLNSQVTQLAQQVARLVGLQPPRRRTRGSGNASSPSGELLRNQRGGTMVYGIRQTANVKNHKKAVMRSI